MQELRTRLKKTAKVLSHGYRHRVPFLSLHCPCHCNNSQFSIIFALSLFKHTPALFCLFFVLFSRLPISFCFSSSLRSSNSTKSLILLVSLSFTSLLNTIFYSLLLTNQNKFVFEGSTNFIIIAALTLVIKASWYFRQVTYVSFSLFRINRQTKTNDELNHSFQIILTLFVGTWGLRLCLFLLFRYHDGTVVLGL